METAEALARITAVQTKPSPWARIDASGFWNIQGFLGFVFSRQPIDALVFAPASHEGGTFDSARQIYHRLLGRLAARQIYFRQWACIAIGGLLCLPALTNPEHYDVVRYDAVIYPDLAAVVVLLTLCAGVVGLPVFFMRGVCGGSVRSEVEGVVCRCFLREVPAGAPPDLRDPWRHGWLTSEARPLSTEITEADQRYRLTKVVAWWWVPSLLCLAIGLANLIFGGPGLVAVAAVAVLKLSLDRNPIRLRVLELEAAEAVEAHAFVEAGGREWGLGCEAARARQIGEAIRERTEPVVNLGHATGILAGRGDAFAPSSGMEMALSRTDLRTHLLVLGGTGAGKTSGLLRPIARQVAAWENTGLLVLDGKGSLPKEIAASAGLTLIDPAKDCVSLVKGLDPVTLVDTLMDIVEPAGERKSGDPFWRNCGATLLRHSAVLCQTAGGPFWNLTMAAQLGANVTLRGRVLEAIAPSQIPSDPALAAAVEFFQYDWTAMDERTRSGIVATVQSWVAVLAAHGDLLRWARATPEEDEIPLENFLRGGRFGLLLPAHRYGRAGTLVTALLKARAYGALKARAEGWSKDDSPVLFLIDEAQEVVTREDAAMLSIGRSLGLSVVAASQTTEALVERLGQETAAKWLGTYGSVVALQGRSSQTAAFVAAKLGVDWRPQMESVEGMAVRAALDVQVLSGAGAAARRQPTIARYANPWWRLHRASAGVLGGFKRVMFGDSATPRPVSRLGAAPVVVADELATLLAEPDTALAVLNRARAPRRDIIRLSPEYPSTS